MILSTTVTARCLVLNILLLVSGLLVFCSVSGFNLEFWKSQRQEWHAIRQQQRQQFWHHLLSTTTSVNGNNPRMDDPPFTTAASRSTAGSKRRNNVSGSPSLSVAVSADEIEKDLTAEERTTVRVVRQAGPSVAFVTSVWPFGSTRRNGRDSTDRDSGKNATSSYSSTSSKSKLPMGVSLGSGSAFVVDPDGYLVTNYHVIERAYAIQRMEHQLQTAWNQFLDNITAVTLWNATTVYESSQFLLPTPVREALNRPPPSVFIRFVDGNTATGTGTRLYSKCRIVDVQPDLDLAVLQIEFNDKDGDGDDDYEKQYPAMFFGSSSNLLVGQGLIAIGNPFGLDNSVTTGVVSALNRELQAPMRQLPRGRQQPIRNCIQTDCAINPGNSGGPLLNFQGQVVGVNTAIVSTTGSFAGIGFAVPSDAVEPVVDRIVRNDKVRNLRRPRSSKMIPWMGVQIVQIDPADVTSQGTRRVVGATRSVVGDNDDGIITKEILDKCVKSSRMLCGNKNWIVRVAPGSPAQLVGMKGITLQPDKAKVVLGDAIVAVGGNAVRNFAELQAEMSKRKVGEQVAITLEDGSTGEQRVVYMYLASQKDAQAIVAVPKNSPRGR